jgi:hypothetical protein
MNEEQEPRQQFDEAVTAKREKGLLVRTGRSEQRTADPTSNQRTGRLISGLTYILSGCASRT